VVSCAVVVAFLATFTSARLRVHMRASRILTRAAFLLVSEYSVRVYVFVCRSYDAVGLS
jgi:hypothetical protein